VGSGRDLAACVEKANRDPEVHVIGLSGNGKGFCGGYDLVVSAEGRGYDQDGAGAAVPPGSPVDLLRTVRVRERARSCADWA